MKNEIKPQESDEATNALQQPVQGPDRDVSLEPMPDGDSEWEMKIRSQSLLNLPPVVPWTEPVDGKLLLDEIRQALRRFVVLPKWAEETLALWVFHTYAFELRDVSAYMGIESPEKRCGKTTLMIVLSELVNRPEVAANISSPAFYRMIEETHPTLFIDEADTYLRRNEQLRGILNAGYSRKMAYVVRVTNQKRESSGQTSEIRDHGSNSRLARFSCWCPKVIAAIGRLPDTLADRCIILRMQRKTLTEPCERLKTLNASVLRRKCARFVMDHVKEIASAQPQIPPGLNDRAADIWEPLLVLSDLAGGEWPMIARQAAVGLTARAQANNPIGSLLLDIFVLFATHEATRMLSRDLVAGLNALSDRPWVEMRNGKEITDRWLAKQLLQYEIRPRSLRLGDEVARGYFHEDFKEVFRRYIPRSEWEALKAEVEAQKPAGGQAPKEPGTGGA